MKNWTRENSSNLDMSWRIAFYFNMSPYSFGRKSPFTCFQEISPSENLQCFEHARARARATEYCNRFRKSGGMLSSLIDVSVISTLVTQHSSCFSS